MKKTLLLAACCLFAQTAVFAQETEVTTVSISETTVKRENPFNFYVGFGAAFLGDFNINDKLAQSGMPQVASTAPEFTFGFNFSDPGENLYMDVEGVAAYLDKKDDLNRVRTVSGGAKIRVHYKLKSNEKWFLSVGGDLNFLTTQVNINSRDNIVDMNNLNPAAYTGNISLYNNQFGLGPSVAVAVCQDMLFPLRFNFGYDIGLTKGKWKSQYADVSNTIDESGHGRFYAKLIIGL